MSFLRRASTTALRNIRSRAAGPKESFWADGKHEPTGYLFNETPPPPGQSRKWESWEAPWYLCFGASTVLLAVGLPSRPDTSMVSWAHKQAEKELAEEFAD
ncbi:hypothetical protein WJX74_002990 [Apatococcus lobatus]|uniref:NADH dehydrogenase [ubiquinone] 1 beta subcomplex subunit 11, mitochondrial n=1 Tax=Apatococcus lobatus TaxID=904363 RepID=A0AAW1RX58_9CHLO